MSDSRRLSSVCLLSGGLDSAANLRLCREFDEPILALTIDYGQRAARSEIRAAAALCKRYGVRHEVLALPWLGALGGSSLTESSLAVPKLDENELDDRARTLETARSVWVPNRNGVLINVAAAYAERLGARQLIVGFNREEATTFPDNSGAFLEAASQALSYSTANGARVRCYTVDMDKTEIVATIRKLDPGFPFELVWSCYLDGDRPCRACESCRRFARAVRS